MSCSKLEIYVDILDVLAQRGPLKASQITCKAHVSCNVLKKQLDFLLKQGLIEETESENNIAYANTDRGNRVINFFRNLDKALPTKENDEVLSVPY